MLFRSHLWGTYYVHVPDAVLNPKEGSQNRTDTCPSFMKANAAEGEDRMESKFRMGAATDPCKGVSPVHSGLSGAGE